MMLKELIQRAIDIAQPGIDPLVRAVVELTAEPLLPVVFGEVGDELASHPSTRHLLRRIKTVNVVNGSVALSDDVLTAYACESLLFDPDALDEIYSLTNWQDFLSGQLDSRLGHFLINEGTLFVVDPGSQYVHSAGPTKDYRLVTPCSLVVPGIAVEVDVPEEVTDLIIKRLAQSLRAGFTK
jgi:hypothetical protein